MKQRLITAWWLALALSLSGCEQQGPAPDLPSDADRMLGLVPADTPYVFASAKPLPRALTERLLANSSAGFESDQARIADQLAEDPDNQALRMLEALHGEFEGKLNAAGLQQLGFTLDARVAVYGIGLLPTMRLEIADAAKVRALMERIQERSGVRLESRDVAGQSYWALDDQKITLIVAVTQQELILSLLPTPGLASLLPLALGQTRPGDSLADADTFEQLRSRYGYSGYGEGYVDLSNLAQQIAGNPQGVNAVVLDSLGLQPENPHLSPGCDAFAQQLVAYVPRISSGVTQASADGYRLYTIVETAEVIGGRLQRLGVPVPGLGADDHSPLQFGVAMSIPELRGSLRSMLQSLAEMGTECDKLDADELSQSIQAIELVLNPMVSGVKGFSLRVGDIKPDSGSGIPKQMDATLVVAANDPRGLFGMLALFDPKLAQLKIDTDGVPTALPMADLAPDAPPGHVAMSSDAIALAVGRDSSATAASMLQAKSSAQMPMLHISIDGNWIVQQLNDAAPLLSSGGEDGEIVRQKVKAMQQHGADYGRHSVTVYGTVEGLVIDQQVEFNKP